jgi:hypothetical protein
MTNNIAPSVQYGVLFVGYAAELRACTTDGHEVDYVTLDFISGLTIVSADGGYVGAAHRVDLPALVAK